MNIYRETHMFEHKVKDDTLPFLPTPPSSHPPQNGHKLKETDNNDYGSHIIVMIIVTLRPAAPDCDKAFDTYCYCIQIAASLNCTVNKKKQCTIVIVINGHFPMIN